MRVLTEPFNQPYMLRALVAMLTLALLTGVVSVIVQLRRLSFMAESLTHSIFPGLAIAFFSGGSLLTGALIAALAAAVALTLLSHLTTVDDDAVLALLLASLFSIGVVIVSRKPTFSGDLERLLFGRLLSVSTRNLVETAIVAIAALTVLVALRKELFLRAFDAEGARASGYPVLVLDLAFNAVVALTIVAAVRAVGTALVVALLITPAATARMLSSRIGPMVAWSCALAGLGGWVGLGVSYDASVHHDVNLAAAPSVVLLLTVMFGAVAVATRAAAFRGHDEPSA